MILTLADPTLEEASSEKRQRTEQQLEEARRASMYGDKNSAEMRKMLRKMPMQHQFGNSEAILELLEKQHFGITVSGNKKKKKEAAEPGLTTQEEAQLEELYGDCYTDWLKTDFDAFIKG